MMQRKFIMVYAAWLSRKGTATVLLDMRKEEIEQSFLIILGYKRKMKNSMNQKILSIVRS